MYATVDQFVARFGLQESLELTNLEDPCAESINTTRLERALRDGSALIDSHIQLRVTLPLEPEFPATLIWACCDIARYHLDHKRTREEVRLRYEDRMVWLRDIAKGVVNLGLAPGCPPTTPTAVPDLPCVASRCTVFTEDILGEYADLGGGW